MRSLTLIILSTVSVVSIVPLALGAAQSNELADELFDRAVEGSRMSEADLDDSMLAKASNLALHPFAGAVQSRPKVSAVGIAPMQLRRPLAAGASRVFCTAAGCDDSEQRLPATAVPLGRRDAGFGMLGGLAMAAHTLPAFAEDEDLPPPPPGFKKASVKKNGVASPIQYKDEAVGEGGSTITPGDVIKANYVTKLYGGEKNGKVVDQKTNAVIEVGNRGNLKGYDAAILGVEGEMSPMNVGGKRIVLIPARLAFGKKGQGCNDKKCFIPPDNALEFTVEIVSNR
eukprot:gnl/TRDRNA2_/TRDRNA2_152044_c0_seq2.p1 gnl/TRDRNA2_/TRDRNA2_152044_c0~~gnl/TRDRNA2_/TRDRNA2_152044_c0_seq2.p1  ORF type:complete len:285 (+),score=57.98 gnl/TRDRNA2_/TRDRNA2_152044_c0_seq2:73-927(+)